MSTLNFRKLALPALAGAVALLSAAPTANATIVERIVAVVGERPVLWTDLVHRAASLRVEIRVRLLEQYLKQHPDISPQTVDVKVAIDPNLISVQEQEMYKDLLDRVIDDRLEEQQAERAHITVTPEDIDRGLSNIASQAQGQQGHAVTVQDVLGEVHRRGMSEQDFRDEIRRQLLEGKLIELRVRPRVRVTEQDAHTSYQHWLQELKDQEPVDVRVLPLRVLPQSSPQQVDARMALAQEIVQKARTGTDFCQLVQQYSDDVSTRATCGSRGAQPMGILLPPSKTPCAPEGGSHLRSHPGQHRPRTRPSSSCSRSAARVSRRTPT